MRRDLRARLHRGAVAGKHLERRRAQVYLRVSWNYCVLCFNDPHRRASALGYHGSLSEVPAREWLAGFVSGMVGPGWWRWSTVGDALCVCPRPYTRRPPSPSRHRARWWQVRCAPIPQRHQKGGQRRGKHEAFTVLFCCGCCIAHTELASASARIARNVCA